MGMTIDVQPYGEGTILRVHGEVDMDSSPDLKTRMFSQLKSASVLRLDLADVEYIDSSGVAVLIQGLKDAQANGARLILFNPSKSVREVLELAMLNHVFTIEDSKES